MGDATTRNALLNLAQAVLTLQTQVYELRMSLINQDKLAITPEEFSKIHGAFLKHIEEFIKVLENE